MDGAIRDFESSNTSLDERHRSNPNSRWRLLSTRQLMIRLYAFDRILSFAPVPLRYCAHVVVGQGAG